MIEEGNFKIGTKFVTVYYPEGTIIKMGSIDEVTASASGIRNGHMFCSYAKWSEVKKASVHLCIHNRILSIPKSMQ